MGLQVLSGGKYVKNRRWRCVSLVWKAVHYYPQVSSITTKVDSTARMLPESVLSVTALAQAFLSCLKYCKSFLTVFVVFTLTLLKSILQCHKVTVWGLNKNFMNFKALHKYKVVGNKNRSKHMTHQVKNFQWFPHYLKNKGQSSIMVLSLFIAWNKRNLTVSAPVTALLLPHQTTVFLDHTVNFHTHAALSAYNVFISSSSPRKPYPTFKTVINF